MGVVYVHHHHRLACLKELDLHGEAEQAVHCLMVEDDDLALGRRVSIRWIVGRGSDPCLAVPNVVVGAVS